MPTTSSEYQWFQLKKEFFGLDKNVYACCVYYSPRNPSYNANSDTDLLDLIGADMSQYSKDGNILICGDLNARTGCGEPDFIINDDRSYVPLSDNYLQDTELGCRISQDNVIDARGRELLDFCIESQLRILNGRTFGVTQGMYTSYKYNGNSVVDYMITSENLLPQLL